MTTKTPRRNARSGKVFLGLLLLVVGSILLLDQLGLYLPDWLISWPMFLIALGLHNGIRHNFRNPTSYILLLIGVIFLFDDIFPSMDFDNLAWPVVLICFGLYMITGRNKSWRAKRKAEEQAAADLEWDRRQTDPVSENPEQPEPQYVNGNGLDFVDAVSIFGGVKKNIVSKTFKGGDIVNFMGGCELNLTQADITGKAVLEVTQVFGGTKIIVPPHWEVHPEMTAIFGGIEDKRPFSAASASPEKVLIIRGTSIFGGIDIRSY